MSVSSMRNTNVPPWCRAKAQLNSAVRARPTCGLPVGDGQNLTRTAEPSPAGAGSVTSYHLVGQGPDAGDRHVDLVAGAHGSDTFGCAGEDHVAGKQGHHGGDV